MDPSDSAVEFSQTHFSRDDDLISLQIEPHRYVYMYVYHVYILNNYVSIHKHLAHIYTCASNKVISFVLSVVVIMPSLSLPKIPKLAY